MYWSWKCVLTERNRLLLEMYFSKNTVEVWKIFGKIQGMNNRIYIKTNLHCQYCIVLYCQRLQGCKGSGYVSACVSMLFRGTWCMCMAVHDGGRKKCKWVSVCINSMCECLTTLWKSCWFSAKGHLCHFLWPSWRCDCDSEQFPHCKMALFLCAIAVNECLWVCILYVSVYVKDSMELKICCYFTFHNDVLLCIVWFSIYL